MSRSSAIAKASSSCSCSLLEWDLVVREGAPKLQLQVPSGWLRSVGPWWPALQADPCPLRWRGLIELNEESADSG